MALHFILDGYNIINQAFPKDSTTLKRARERLFGFIENYHPQGSQKNRVTIVFDSKEDFSGENSPYLFKVIFSKGESADNCIRNMVEKSANPRNIIVVTDDNELKFYVRKSGAKLMAVKEFLAKAKVKKSMEPQEDIELSFYLSNKITSELRQLWLKGK